MLPARFIDLVKYFVGGSALPRFSGLISITTAKFVEKCLCIWRHNIMINREKACSWYK